MERNDSGAVFKNRFKTTDRHPDYKGDAMIDGVKKQVAVWVKKDKNGNDFLSLKFEEPMEMREAGPKLQVSPADALYNPTPSISDVDDGLPF